MDTGIITFIFSQLFGVFALICTVVSMQLKKKRPLMILQTASEAFIVAQYFVKGAFTGSCMSVVSFIRDVIFTKHSKKRTPFFVLLSLYAVMTLLTILTWAGPLSILPFVGSLIYAWTLWYGEVKWIRLGNAVGNTPYIIYTIATGNYVLFIMTLIEVISAAAGFIRLDVLKKEPKSKRAKSPARRKLTNSSITSGKGKKAAESAKNKTSTKRSVTTKRKPIKRKK